MLWGYGMETPGALALAALLLASPARAGDRSGSFRVAVRVVKPLVVRAAAPPLRASGAPSARLSPPATSAGAAVLAGLAGEVHRPCAPASCDGAVPAPPPGATVILTVLPDGAPTALVER